jgi:hypothetical protein
MKTQPKLKWYQRGFAVMRADGFIYPYTIRFLKRQSIREFCQEDKAQWRKYYRDGWRIVRVTITPAPAKKGKR